MCQAGTRALVSLTAVAAGARGALTFAAAAAAAADYTPVERPLL